MSRWPYAMLAVGVCLLAYVLGKPGIQPAEAMLAGSLIGGAIGILWIQHLEQSR